MNITVSFFSVIKTQWKHFTKTFCWVILKVVLHQPLEITVGCSSSMNNLLFISIACIGRRSRSSSPGRCEWSPVSDMQCYKSCIMNRPNGQQCLAKPITDHTSLWWFNTKVLFRTRQTDVGHKPIVPASQHGLTDNMQFFVWHGSQNLCQTMIASFFCSV